MSTPGARLQLSPQETLARDLIMERVAARHRAERRQHPSRAARLLRSLADRIDPTDDAHHGVPADQAGRADQVPTPQPRPWSATPRRAPHLHSG